MGPSTEAAEKPSSVDNTKTRPVEAQSPPWVIPIDINRCNELVSQIGVSQDQMAVVAELRESFPSLAFHAQGCRLAQDALDKANRDVQMELALTLRSHIREAINSPHANYVVQKIVEALPPSNVPFIVEELNGDVLQIAQHRYGVRILCRVLEHCPPKMIERLIAQATENVALLCRHKYGTYLAQHIMEYGTSEQCRIVVRTLAENSVQYAKHRSGSTLIERALLHTELPEQRDLLKTLLQDATALAQVASSRHGFRVIKALLEFPGDESQSTRHLLQCEEQNLQTSKHGQRVLSELKPVDGI